MWHHFFRRQLNPIGSRALSHDSIFIPEESAREQHLDHSMSQENVSDKVRNLQVRLVLEAQTHLAPRVTSRFLSEQKQIAQGIKFGQRPPSLRKSEEDEGSTDDEEVPQSPLKVLAHVEPELSNPESKVRAFSPQLSVLLLF